jgi:glutamate synthase (NADPH/NADH) small chain
MGKATGFLEHERELPPRRPIEERLRDFREFEGVHSEEILKAQAARCMDCGIPFCHQGCPLGNLIPEFNDLIYRGRWREASARLHRTNNFPEFTGRVCPAPCEEACVLSIDSKGVTIKQIERQIVDRAFEEGWIAPVRAVAPSGRRIAVVGSGPAGLACAQELARAGHAVTVFERSDRVGGLLRYGIPDFKLEKWRLDRRVLQLEAEGVVFKTGVEVGVDLGVGELRRGFDAICLAIGATRPRDLGIPGRSLQGVHFAMDFLSGQNRAVAGDGAASISAEMKRVVVLGGGDTGADCVGTSHRQGARSVHQLELMPAPPSARTADMPWPSWPIILRTSSSHEEGGVRDFGVSTHAFLSDEADRVRALSAVRVAVHKGPDGRSTMSELPGSEFVLEADLVLLALGFLGPEPRLITELGAPVDARGAVQVDDSMMTGVPGVFACGDAKRGPSLVVWAIAEGRDAAQRIDLWLKNNPGGLK